MKNLLIILLFPLISFSQNILYHETADGKWFNSTYAKLQAAAWYSITASTNQYFNGTKSVRFELRDTDNEVQGGTRAEIVFPVATNLNRWYSFAIYFPKGDYLIDNADEVITQWHQGGGKTPALCLRTKNDRLYLRIMGNIWIDLGLIDKDNWHTYVMRVNHSSGSTGSIDIWRDNNKILNRTGPNMYKVTGDIKNPNWKLGIYKSTWNGSSTTRTKKRVLYFDDIKMGNENSNYAQMLPRR